MKLFRDIIDKQELAALLHVNERALDVVELLDGVICMAPGCVYPAVSRNALHGRKGCQGQKGQHMCVVHNQGAPRSFALRKKIVDALRHSLPEATLAKLRDENQQALCLYIAPWHFHPDVLELDATSREWRLRAIGKSETFRDAEKILWKQFPPPNYNPELFKNSEESRLWTHPSERWIGVAQGQGALPLWTKVYRGVESPVSKPHASAKSPVVNRITKRALNQADELSAKDESIAQLRRQLAECKSQLEEKNGVIATTAAKEENLLAKVHGLEDRVGELMQNLENARKRGGFLSYEDLAPGGRLADHVAAYTYFPNYKANEAFLRIVNWEDEDEGGGCSVSDGLCVDIRCYSHVKREEREAPDSQESSESVTYPDRRVIHWKTEYLVFSSYMRTGMTYVVMAPLFGVSTHVISDIVHGWAIFMNRSLSLWFPTPTRSQMIRAYPDRFVWAYGHALVFLLLDATEYWNQTTMHSDAHSSMHSDYKGHDTTKMLAGTDPIGLSHNGSLAKDGFPGSLSDPLATEKSGLLKHVPFGHATLDDKGFTIDNLAASMGVGTIRPPKKLHGQKKQSALDLLRLDRRLEIYGSSTRSTTDRQRVLLGILTTPCPSCSLDLLRLYFAWRT